jgi:hypothetical protein
MPDESEKKVMERAKRDEAEGKSASTQAGEFVREEMHHVREGQHGARSPQQAIAIGLSKARRAGVDLPPPKEGTSSPEVRKQAARDTKRGRNRGAQKTSRPRSRATTNALRREGHSAASSAALGRQARSAAKRRGAASRHDAAMKAVHTKGAAGLRSTGRKAARTRSKGKS